VGIWSAITPHNNEPTNTMSNTIPITSTQFSLLRHGIRVDFDASEIYPDDPGAGTPVLVTMHDGSGTYHCVREMGEIVGDETTYVLNSRQVQWLWDIGEKVESWLRFHGDRRGCR